MCIKLNTSRRSREIRADSSSRDGSIYVAICYEKTKLKGMRAGDS
jgi:hypothetical protein